MHSIDTNISSTDQWRDVEALASSITETSLRALFDADPERGSRLGVTAGDPYVDLSKNLITDEVVSALLALARAADLPARPDRLRRVPRGHAHDR